MALKIRARLCTLFLFFFMSSVYAAPQGDCLSYQPTEVRLTGTISRKTFPGPPNYKSIRKGDKPETYWVLHLAKPICTTASANNDAESGVTELQLILTGKQSKLYKKFVGRKMRVTVKGKLSHAITGHHHMPVLMEVVNITEPQWEELKEIEIP